MIHTRTTTRALIPALILVLALSGCGGKNDPANPPAPAAQITPGSTGDSSIAYRTE